MEQGQSLDSILSDDVPEVVEAVVVETPEPEQAEAPVRDEQGRFAAKTGVEPQPETEAGTVPPTDKLPQEDYKAIREEREKRQRLEAELATLKQQIQQPQAPPAPPPSIWEDEQGWQQNMQHQIMQQADQLSRINASEMAARVEFPDFDTKFEVFNQMAVQNPQIVQQAMADPHPWRKAYQIASNYQTMQELAATDVNDLKAKLREEIMAEMQAQQLVPQPMTLPPSITGQRNVGTRSGPAWSGPKPLADLLG